MLTFDPGGQFERDLRAKAAALQSVARDLGVALQRGIVGIGQASARRAAELTPRSPGAGPHVADGWEAEVTVDGADVSVRVHNADPRFTEPLELADGSRPGYTLGDILEYGSRPHEIAPVKAKTLVFLSRLTGRVTRSKRVVHPGTRPYSMLALTKVAAAKDGAALMNALARVVRARFR